VGEKGKKPKHEKKKQKTTTQKQRGGLESRIKKECGVPTGITSRGGGLRKRILPFKKVETVGKSRKLLNCVKNGPAA